MGRILGAVLLLACGGSTLRPAPPHLPTSDPHADARDLLVAHGRDPSVERCPRLRSVLGDVDVLQIHDATWLRRAGEAMAFCGAPEEAARLVATSIALDESCEARVWLARLRSEGDNAPAAEAHLRDAIRRHPACAAAGLELASLLRETGRPDDAVVLLSEALRNAPTSARSDLFASLAGTFLATGELAQAELACRQALHLDETRAASWNVCGMVDLAAGRITEALQRFERAYTIDPELVEAWMNHGHVALDYRDFEEAERLFGEAALRRPESYEAQVERGVALRALGRIDEARGCYETALVLAPSRPEAHYDLALLLQEHPRDREDLRAARRHYEAFIERAGAELTDAIATARRRLGELPD